MLQRTHLINRKGVTFAQDRRPLERLSDIFETASNPTSVFQRSASTFVYSDDKTTNHSGDPLLVPVKVVQGTSGRVRTFYFASTENFATVIWRKSNG